MGVIQCIYITDKYDGRARSGNVFLESFLLSSLLIHPPSPLDKGIRTVVVERHEGTCRITFCSKLNEQHGV
jgi:hypothetical protein